MNLSRCLLLVTLALCLAAPVLAQHLPAGTYRTNRERTSDLVHLKSVIQVDWKAKKVLGETKITFRPLSVSPLLSLDAYWLSVTSAQMQGTGKMLRFLSTDSSLTIYLDRMYQPSETLTVVIQHSSRPTAGLYFLDASSGRGPLPSIQTYGEGGLHANWLPIFADPNDKFSTEMVITVDKPYGAVSNGRLVEHRGNPDGSQTFHWLQEKPHSGYLVALFVGDCDSVQLAPAFGSIPLTCWVPRGRKEEGRFVFRNTTKMVEFFSERFDYRFPWEKYDQVVAPDYQIGAMENTSVTGHRDDVLRSTDVPDDSFLELESYASNWTTEEIISHELAHHWFGDNVTCRSLASIWLNESFGTYAHMLWDEHSEGREYLQFRTWLALQSYLRYVRKEHIIRPMEYRRYDSREEMYNDEHTYLKGALLLHTLRWILGDADFFSSLSSYLHKHEFSNVESADLKTALEESTGRDLQWFFDQWVYGGGHPRFEVSYRYHADRKVVDLTVHQTQPLVEGQGLFTLPVEIRIDTPSKTERDTLWVRHETDHYTVAVDQKPLMVSFDGRGVIVRELIFEKELEELLYQLTYDDLPGRLWALHQLVERYSSHPRTVQAVGSVLDGNAQWWLKAEAALQLRHIPTPAAERLLIDQLSASDYHIRKAAVIALGAHYGSASGAALRRVIGSDPQTDVAAAALLSLSKVDSSLNGEFFKTQMRRRSWYDEIRIASLMAMKVLGRREFVPLIRENCALSFNMAVRLEALSAWASCAPDDQRLHESLNASAADEVLRVRQRAIELLSDLKIESSLPVLEAIRQRDGDGDIRKAARDAIAEIKRLSVKK